MEPGPRPLSETAPDAGRARRSTLLRFLVPSLVGVVVFLVPVFEEQRQTIVFSLLTDALAALLGGWLDEILVAVVTVAALGALVARLRGGPAAAAGWVGAGFHTSWGWIALRVAGLGVVACVYLEIGPGIVRLPDTGQVVLNDIGINMMLIFTVGVLFLPALTEYGLMEFVGALFRRTFERVFRLPGRAAIDMTASIVSASSVGLLVTIGQYERGYYNGREAAVIACSFSIVSIPFCVLIADVAGLGHVFFGWYLSVVAACLVCAGITARLPPLSRKPEEYLTVARTSADLSAGTPLELALARAAAGPGPAGYARLVARTFGETVFGVIAPTMALATLAAVAVFHTPVFDWGAAPVRWLLELGGVAEAGIIAPGFLVGLLDQFMPALVAQSVTSDLWRFVLGGLSVTQLVFLSEFGVLVLRSRLPVNLADLVQVFVLRTLVTTPLLIAAGILLT